jgi:hypothetical protein
VPVSEHFLDLVSRPKSSSLEVIAASRAMSLWCSCDIAQTWSNSSESTKITCLSHAWSEVRFSYLSRFVPQFISLGPFARPGDQGGRSFTHISSHFPQQPHSQTLTAQSRIQCFDTLWRATNPSRMASRSRQCSRKSTGSSHVAWANWSTCLRSSSSATNLPARAACSRD